MREIYSAQPGLSPGNLPGGRSFVGDQQALARFARRADIAEARSSRCFASRASRNRSVFACCDWACDSSSSIALFFAKKLGLMLPKAISARWRDLLYVSAISSPILKGSTASENKKARQIARP
ncbi:UNVERIFIED_ORG: hypothetical protein M2312_002103 [Rhizobium esperanzae]|uniref:Uncharacterized protein n=1 Tax=Rhizobium phaseoli TaxID=396 RepID=A0A7T0EAK8_9HYPH|nr:hypothetical protein [Rhizobium esperanzae]QPK08175.1 hypothetical protein HER27_017200 [Rhizobium phaseoli]